MLVLGLQGSPRRKGNTAYLLDLFMSAARKTGAHTRIVSPAREAIEPCKGCGACERHGACVSQDVMAKSIFPLLRQADVIVAASPVYFYGVTATLKGLIDRCQTLWARKYRLRLTDPGAGTRRGVMLAVGASHGPKLFDGLHLTVDYFFDAIAAGNAGSLTYRGVEHAGDMARLTDAHGQVASLARRLCEPLVRRRRVAFVDGGQTGAGWMAAVWMRHLAGESWDVYADAAAPAAVAATLVEKAMAERGIDIGYAGIQPLAEAALPMDRVVALGTPAGESSQADVQWALAAGPEAFDHEACSALCDDIQAKVRRLIDGLESSL